MTALTACLRAGAGLGTRRTRTPHDVKVREISAIRQLAAVVLFSPLALSAFPAPAASAHAQLPPEILVDRHLLRVERLLAADDPQALSTR